MQKESIKFAESTVFEGMTSIRSIIKSYDLKISDRRIEKILYDKDRKDKIRKELGYFRAVAEKYGFYLEEVSGDELEKITLGNSHGGIVAVATKRTIPYFSDLSDGFENGFYVMIDGIEDPYNFGYALRSLYACGATGIILPERNWMSAAGVVCRSSAGASELFPMYLSDNLTDMILKFKSGGYTVVCADERTDNILGATPLRRPILLIVGGEKRGISKSVLSLADIRVKINYSRDFNASLSAASATTMFAYEIMRQNDLK